MWLQCTWISIGQSFADKVQTRSIDVRSRGDCVGWPVGAWAMIHPGATVESDWTLLLGLLVGVPLGFLIRLVLGVFAWCGTTISNKLLRRSGTKF